jgi:hypothetical protein
VANADKYISMALRIRNDMGHGGLGQGERFDAAVTHENMAQIREAQGRFIDARKMRLQGQAAGQMVCGNYSAGRDLLYHQSNQ